MSLYKNPNVRAGLRQAWARAALWLAIRFRSRLAVRRLAQQFLSPRSRRSPSAAERAQFDAARRFMFDFQGEQLVGYRFGSGPKVLLLHGLGGSASQMYAFVQPLVAAGFEVVALDAPAHGESGGSWIAIPRYGAAIAQLAEHEGPMHALIAHSLGAPAATFALRLGLQTERMVFVGAPADAFVYFILWARSLGLPGRLTARVRAEIEARAGYPMELLNAERMGDVLRAPLLVIHDREDREVPWHDGERVRRSARDGRMLTTTGLGHRRILHDAQVVQAAVEFIGSPQPHARVA